MGNDGRCNHKIKCWKLQSTVDGSEIRRSPVDMVNFPLLTEGFHISQVVGLKSIFGMKAER